MIIKKLSVYNFKNHSEKKFEFSPQINCFVGNNGVENQYSGCFALFIRREKLLGNTDLNNIKSEEDFSPSMLKFRMMTVTILSESPSLKKLKSH
jgi:DNA replication and repair protein RecF